MCLAVPGKLIETAGDDGIVDLQGNHLRISTVLTPEARSGDWVLVHAGFAISEINEADALEIWSYLREMAQGEVLEEAGADVQEGDDA
jgi:hydrogenase expression/formation protein HypC